MAKELQSKLNELAEKHGVPGTAVGIYEEGKEHFTSHGVTSVENPLPVDENTLFQIGSTGKTLTATAIMRLVDQGKVDLDAPVRTYVPELQLKDDEVAREVRVVNLLNHTAGWEGDYFEDTGQGDDALAKYVEKMNELEQEFALESSFSYNNAAVSLAGRVIEKVTSKTYEQAIKDLVFEPVGLEQSFFFFTDIMTRRFSAAHNNNEDGSVNVVRPWGESRAGNPAGANISMSAKDLIAWARFHLEKGKSAEGVQILPPSLIEQMQEPWIETHGALGDFVGITWILQDIDGVRFVTHGGSSMGVHCEYMFAPERDLALAILVNSGPGGPALQNELVKWILEDRAGLVQKDPVAIEASEEELGAYAGSYQLKTGTLKVTSDAGKLKVEIEFNQQMLQELLDAGTLEEAPPVPPPARLGLIDGPGDRFVAVDAPYDGMKGFFKRSETGSIDGIHFGGRLAGRVSKGTS